MRSSVGGGDHRERELTVGGVGWLEIGVVVLMVLCVRFRKLLGQGWRSRRRTAMAAFRSKRLIVWLMSIQISIPD